MRTVPGAAPLVLAAAVMGAACEGAGEGAGEAADGVVVTFSASAVGAEAEVLRGQLERFMAANPDVRVEIHATPRPTPPTSGISSTCSG